MTQLIETEAFVTVVEVGSFAAAGERLGISSSYASKLVARLEDRLGVRLLHRTTRKLTLTEAGKVYHEVCAEALGLISHAEDDVLALQAAPRGSLRVTLPTQLGLRWLSSWVADFCLANPQLILDVVYLDRTVDLIGEGFDVALRGGVLPDSGLVARRVATACRMVVASPAYLARAGAPTTPEQLAEHACLLYSNNTTPSRWTMSAGEERRTIEVAGPMRANNGDALVRAAVRGVGLAYLPEFHVAEAIARGELVRVLDGWTTHVPLHALYPSGRHLPLKVRAFVDGLAAYLADPPWRPARADQPPPSSA